MHFCVNVMYYMTFFYRGGCHLYLHASCTSSQFADRSLAADSLTGRTCATFPFGFWGHFCHFILLIESFLPLKKTWEPLLKMIECTSASLKIWILWFFISYSIKWQYTVYYILDSLRAPSDHLKHFTVSIPIIITHTKKNTLQILGYFVRLRIQYSHTHQY